MTRETLLTYQAAGRPVISSMYLRKSRAEDHMSLEETLSNISPSEEPCRYYLLTGYIQGMLEALTMLTTVEDGKRFKIKLEQFRQNLLLSGDYDATGNYKQAVKKTAV